MHKLFQQLESTMKDLSALRQDFELGSLQLKQYFEAREREKIQSYKQRLSEPTSPNTDNYAHDVAEQEYLM